MATINPFMQPINYSTDVQSPFESALGGFKIGAGMAEVQAARQKRELEIAALAQAQQRQTDLADLFKNPNATSADYARVTAFLPKDQAKIVQDNFTAQTAEQQQQTLRQGAQVYTAIKSGNLDVAEMQLKEQAAALRNSGKEQQAQAYDDVSNLIRLNPTGAQATIGLLVAALPGGKDFLDNADKALATIRAETKAPAELRAAIAKADKDEADAITAQAQAKNAPEKAAADALLAKAQAAKAEVDAKYAERIAVDKIIADAASLGLTKAQTNEVLAKTSKLGVETKQAVLQLKALQATGGVDPDKKFTQEEKIRKEHQTRTKVYGELQGTFGNIKSSADTGNGPGDIALITSFMKMLDPGSVVRETEFATARDTAGLFTQLENRLQKAKDGQLLNPAQRKEYVALAQKYLESAQKKAGEEKVALGVIVKNYKLNPENVFGPEEKPATPLPTSATIGGKTYSRPANFTDAQWGDYLKANGVIQ
jgi:hypothetical protein